MMNTLSLCMIVKNEADVIGRCLDCVKDIADEIIVVDTGSTDQTKEIVKGYTDKLYEFPWIDDFAAARNFSFSKATKDYIMWLDADDIIDPENQAMLRSLKEALSPDVDMVMMRYHVAFDENDHPTFSYYRERFLKRSANYRWVGAIHEVITPAGKVVHEEIAIRHKKTHPNESGRNLKIFEKMQEQGVALDPRQQYYYARELYYNGRYKDSIAMFSLFLQEGKGWIENNISACRDLSACYQLENMPQDALEALFKSFSYDQPRAEICCDIGKHFFDRQQYPTAAFWYETALSRKMDETSGGFYLLDSYGYTPAIQLCVCYDRLGNRQRAVEYNELAGSFKPTDKNYLYNKQYFDRLKSD